ncbi:MAG TPA: DNA modification methylase [Phycisphaerales bacterium]|nr:DNA modification methylase [Phycisphaerales bacterium]
MKIENRPLSTIKPYDRNPRRNDHAVAAVAASISKYGFRQPIVLDKDGVIIVGHTRFKAAILLGMQSVPVHVAAELTPEQTRALRIADNKTSDLATWDDALLAGELAALEQLNIPLHDIGFSEQELTQLLGELNRDGETEPDDTPAAKQQVETKAGDLWLLGNHRLLCGDATNLSDVRLVMDGQLAKLVATDPPYLVDYTGERPNDSGKDWSDTFREIDITDPRRFFTDTFRNVLDVLAPHAPIYTWHAHKRSSLIAGIWDELGILNHQQIVWVKPSAVFGRVFWHFRHEPCMMGWRQGSQPVHDSDHTFSSVWDIDWEGKSRIVGNEHPTQKPVELFARPMRKHTKPGDICFEPFCGSGSQIIAAEREGRRCFAIELEPVFVEVAVRRWEVFTGKRAQRVAAPTTTSNAATCEAAAKTGGKR